MFLLSLFLYATDASLGMSPQRSAVTHEAFLQEATLPTKNSAVAIVPIGEESHKQAREELAALQEASISTEWEDVASSEQSVMVAGVGKIVATLRNAYRIAVKINDIENFAVFVVNNVKAGEIRKRDVFIRLLFDTLLRHQELFYPVQDVSPQPENGGQTPPVKSENDISEIGKGEVESFASPAAGSASMTPIRTTQQPSIERSMFRIGRYTILSPEETPPVLASLPPLQAATPTTTADTTADSSSSEKTPRRTDFWLALCSSWRQLDTSEQHLTIGAAAATMAMAILWWGIRRK